MTAFNCGEMYKVVYIFRVYIQTTEMKRCFVIIVITAVQRNFKYLYNVYTGYVVLVEKYAKGAN